MLKTFQLAGGKLQECPAEGGQLAIYINPDAEQRSYLVNQLRIDEHTLNSALDPEELGRIEFEENHFAAIIKRPKRYCSRDNFLFKISSVGLFLFAEKLVVVTADEDFSCDSRPFSRMHTVKDVFLRIILSSVQHFEEHLRVIRKISDELETEITEAVNNKDLLHMFKLEKSLVYYTDALQSNNKVTEKIKNSAVKLAFSSEAVEFIDDLIIEGSQCYQQADSYSDVLSSMMDAWASIINNNLNLRLRRLTVVSVCVMTPTLVVSLFSMNLPLPLPNAITSFWMVMAMAFFSVLGLLLIGHFKKL